MKKNSNDKRSGMAEFHREHWTKPMDQIGVSNLKYTSGEMSNPEELKKSADALASYAKNHRMKY